MNTAPTVTGSTKQAGDTWITPDGRHMMAVQMPDGLMEVEMVQEIATELIDPSPINRDEFDADKASDMEDSLRENGQIMPGIVRPKEGGRYELVAGERRWRGCVKLGIPKLKAMVRDYNDSQAAEILLFENLEREDLSPLQEARIYQSLLDLRSEDGRNLFTLETIAERRFGDRKKVGRVARVLKLMQIPEAMKKALKEGVIKVQQAFLVARIADPKDRETAGKEVLKEQYTGLPMTVEKANRHIAENYQVNIQGAKFDREDADILSVGVKIKLGMTGKPGEDNDGSCARCPHLAKNNPAFAGELAVKSKDGKSQTGIDPNTCTRAMCHGLKLEALWQSQARGFAEKHGLPETCILPLAEGGKKNFWSDSKSRLHLTGALRDYVMVDEKITADELARDEDEMPIKVPTWRQVMKGCEVPYKIVAGPTNEPLLIAEGKLAITAGKQTQPELFAAVEIPETKTSSKERTPEEIETARLAKLAKEREDAIKKEVRLDTVKEVLDRVREKGLGVDGMKILCRAAWRVVSNPEDLFPLWTGKPLDDEHDHENELDEMMEGQTLNGMQALLSLMLVGDDVMYGYTRAEDFCALCEEMKIDPKAVEKRVRKAHEIADKAAAKEVAAAEKTKMKSKGKDKDGTRETELANEELATAEILAKGDEERRLAPSHETIISEDLTPWERLVAMEPDVCKPNEFGMFGTRSACTLSAGKGKGEAVIFLAKAHDGYTASFEWDDPKSPNKMSGGASPSAADLMPTKVQALLVALNDALDVCKASPTMAKVVEILEDAMEQGRGELAAVLKPDFTAEELEACREWRLKNPGAGAGLMADALSLTIDEAYAIIDKLVDAKHDAIAAVKQEHADQDFENQAKLIAAGKKKPSDFIGKKPSPDKDPEAYKKWSQERMRLVRAADKLKQAA